MADDDYKDIDIKIATNVEVNINNDDIKTIIKEQYKNDTDYFLFELSDSIADYVTASFDIQQMAEEAKEEILNKLISENKK